MAFTSHEPLEIAQAVCSQIEHGRYERCELFGDGTAGRRIADILATVHPPVQKRLHYDLDMLQDPVGGAG